MNSILKQDTHPTGEIRPVGYVHFNPNAKKQDPSLSTVVSDLTQELVLLRTKTMKTNRSNLGVTMWSQDVISFR